MLNRQRPSALPRRTPTHVHLLVGMILLTAFNTFTYADDGVSVTTLRAPNGGIQPQVAVDDRGTIHMIYFVGSVRAGDVFYMRSTDGGETFTPALRVNSQTNSAIALGTMRGPQLAVGRQGRAHVVWMGSKQAEPKGPDNETPLLYARLNDEQEAFEPQRNIIQRQPGLDGGCTVAAGGGGNVYVAWHAPRTKKHDEQDRWVWVARSTDDGGTFSVEEAANTEPTGACGCCGMSAFADADGSLYILYRSAKAVVNRDMYLLTSSDRGSSFESKKLHVWNVGQCVMSSAAFAQSANQVLAAWETRRQVYFAKMDPAAKTVTEPVAAPGRGPNRKFPAVASNDRGEIILAWTEGTSFGKGGSVAWQVYDANGSPIPEAHGSAHDLPAWDCVAVFARSDGSFTVVY